MNCNWCWGGWLEWYSTLRHRIVRHVIVMILSHWQDINLNAVGSFGPTKNNHSAMLLSRTNLIIDFLFCNRTHTVHVIAVQSITAIHSSSRGSNTTSNTCYESLLIADSSCSKQKWCKNPSLSRASRCQTGLYLLGVGIAGVNVLELGGVVVLGDVLELVWICSDNATLLQVCQYSL